MYAPKLSLKYNRSFFLLTTHWLVFIYHVITPLHNKSFKGSQEILLLNNNLDHREFIINIKKDEDRYQVRKLSHLQTLELNPILCSLNNVFDYRYPLY